MFIGFLVQSPGSPAQFNSDSTWFFVRILTIQSLRIFVKSFLGVSNSAMGLSLSRLPLSFLPFGIGLIRAFFHFKEVVSSVKHLFIISVRCFFPHSPSFAIYSYAIPYGPAALPLALVFKTAFISSHSIFWSITSLSSLVASIPLYLFCHLF